ncbi:AlpA family phage regulatory protein [Buttiauxella selenatireducens]|uniref:AlpA family phage regulatory protein n=1 Tax=Buttiauxella selenatireducens TaxID=3073902 RepID=A0ABY9S748_9ENTR|nr:AlpA family phage regulatory protein [Buttiauxella sp. R73]WMY73334.1 AlpA family phage regulatory protein [Buttiauxella sp. R73]
MSKLDGSQQPAHYMKFKEVESLTGKSFKTLWTMWAKDGTFPKPHKTKDGGFLGGKSQPMKHSETANLQMTAGMIAGN